MSTFDDRERAEEARYALDQETQFKVMARRNKLLGLWAAEKMGVTGDAAEGYAKEVIAADFEEAGDEDVYRKLSGDLNAKNTGVGEAEIRAKMAELMAVAKGQLMDEA